jgi:hypothetical protein
VRRITRQNDRPALLRIGDVCGKGQVFDIQRIVAIVVPAERIELPTFGLQNRCSTAELSRLRLACLAMKGRTINGRLLGSGENDLRAADRSARGMRVPNDANGSSCRSFAICSDSPIDDSVNEGACLTDCVGFRGADTDGNRSVLADSPPPTVREAHFDNPITDTTMFHGKPPVAWK